MPGALRCWDDKPELKRWCIKCARQPHPGDNRHIELKPCFITAPAPPTHTHHNTTNSPPQVLKVNGQPVNNLGDLVAAVDGSTGPYLEFALEYNQVRGGGRVQYHAVPQQQQHGD